MSVLKAPASKSAWELNTRDAAAMVLISLLVSYAPGEMLWTKDFETKFATLQTERKKIDELQAFYKQYPLAEVGLSDESHYPDTFYRALIVFQGAPLHVDFVRWMDLANETHRFSKAV